MSGRIVRRALSLVAAVGVAASGLTFVGGRLAQAVTLGAISTRMEIDASPGANRVTDTAGNFDWNDILDGTLPGGYVGSGFVSAGIVDASHTIDDPSGDLAQTCDGSDADAAVNNAKLSDNPWPIVPLNVPNAKDLCTGAAAVEVVDIGGQVNYILYQYWTRSPDSTGENSTFVNLEGPSAGRCDDILLETNYNSGPPSTFSQYSWIPDAGDNCADPAGGGTWTSGGAAGVLTVGPNTETPIGNPNRLSSESFGESAFNLTTNGIVPADRCVTFTASGVFTKTGNSNSATLQDFMAFSDPLVVNNCAPVSVGKVTEPAGFAAAADFTYKLDQLDSNPTHDASLLPTLDGDGSFASITDTIQSGQTGTWTNVIAQPDYRLAETLLPTNWSLKQISCTFWDPFFVVSGNVVPQLRTVTSSTNPLSPFVVPPTLTKPAGQPNTSCVITNVTSGIRVAKTGAGNSGSLFSFTRTGGPGFALALNGSPADFGYAPGASVTIAEALPAGTPGWDLTSITCTRLSDGSVVTPGSVDLGGRTATVTTIAGDVVSCLFNNVQQGRIIVQKATTGGTGTFGFTGAVNGSITTVTAAGVPSGAPLTTDLAPGTYSVVETAAPGWATTSTCSDGSAVGAISLQAGEVVTCTFNNTKLAQIVVAKQTTPDGVAQPFGFEGSWTGAADGVADFSITDDATAASPLLAPGAYTVAELAIAGWDLTGLACSVTTPGSGTSSTVVDGATATVTLAAGDVVTCTYSNTQRGTIVVIKNTAGGDGTFGFGGSWAGAGSFAVATSGGTGQQVFSNVLPGSYAVSETDMTSLFDLTNLQCVAGDGGSSPATPVLTTSGSIDLDPGETVICTFSNTKKGTIVIVKDAQPNLADDFSFTSPLGGFTLDDDGNAPLSDNHIFANVQSTAVQGTTYAVTETPTPGWTLDSINCSNNSITNLASATATIAVGAGETVRCTFVNVADPATVTVDKTVSGVATDFPWSFSFSLSPLPITETSPKPVAGTGPGIASVTWGDLVPGATYTVAEELVPGWAQTLTCTGVTDSDGVVDHSVTFVAVPGMVLSCAAVNVADPATIEVVKTTVGGSGPFAFALTPGDVTGLFADTAAANPATTGVHSGLLPGRTYAIAEDDPGSSWIAGPLSCTLDPAGPAGAVATQSTFVAGPGGAVRCEVTNTKKATVVVTKSTVGGEGTFNFTGDFSGSISTNNSTGHITTVDVNPGTYSVVETDPTPAWDLTAISCDDANSTGGVANRAATIVADAGETVRCTFTNTKRGSITVVKDAVPNLADDFSFTSATLGGFILDDDADAARSNTASFANLVPGSHAVTEQAVAGWALASVTCIDTNTLTDVPTATATVVVDPGDNITCTFVNVAAPGTITVNKTTRGGDGTFGYTLAGAGDIVVPSITTASGTGTTVPVSGLQPGETYTISENDPGPDWIPGPMTCEVLHDGAVAALPVATTFIVQPGDDITCGITNTRRGSIVVVKNVAGANGTFDFSGTWLDPVAFALTTAGGTASRQTVNVDPGQYTVQELNLPVDYDGVLNCVDSVGGVASTVNGLVGTVNLDPGETVTCTFTNTQRGTIIVDKVTVPSTDTASVFDFTLSGDPDGFTLTNTQQPHNSGLLVPGNYSLAELAEPGWQLSDLQCASVASSHTVSGASAAITLAAGDTVTCSYTNNQLGPVTVTKTVTAGPTLVSGSTYQVAYELVVTNQSYVAETFDLSDTLDFGAGTSSITATAAAPAGITLVAGWDGLGATLLADDQVILARTEAAPSRLAFSISVTFDVAGSMTAEARDCESIDGEGTGTLNTAMVTSRSGDFEAGDCAVIPEANLEIVKTVFAGPVRAADGTWTIFYNLAVTNTGDGPGHYVLSDAPQFGDGVTVTSATVAAVTAGLSTNPGFDGASDQLVAEADIPAGPTPHVYRVTVKATIAAATASSGAGDCVLTNDEEGTGFLNVATLVVADSSVQSTACAQFGRLTLRKIVVNDDGGDAIRGGLRAVSFR